MDRSELGTLFAGLRAMVTIADEDGRIVFLNDLAVEHYADRGGKALVGTHLNDCHLPASQKKIQEMYARHRAGDLSPTRYKEDQGTGIVESIVVLPITVGGEFRGVAELMWRERRELVFEA